MTKSMIVLPYLYLALPLLAQVPVSLPTQEVPVTERFTVPIEVGDMTDLGIESFDLELRYDAGVLTLDRAEKIGTRCADAMVQFNGETPGVVRISMSSQVPLTGSGTLIQVQGSARVTGDGALHLERILFNEGHPNATIEQGALTVFDLQPVTFTQQPPSHDLCAGEPLILSVEAAGSPPITYQWRRDGIDLPGATLAQLHVPNTEETDSGAYTCVATNPAGTGTSDAAVIAVGAAPRMLSPPRVPIACAGQSVTLRFDMDGPELGYRWQKDGTDLPGADGADLTLPAFDQEDVGAYRCIVTNACGTTTTPDLPLTLDQPVALTAQPQSAYASKGASHSFSVAAEGSQPIAYQWFFRDDPIPYATAPELTIAPVRYDDLGHYRCQVRNGCGSVDSDTVFLNAYDVVGSFTSNDDEGRFGEEVQIHGDQALVTSSRDSQIQRYMGAVDAYTLVAGEWRQTQRLTGSEPTTNAYFGTSIDRYQDRLIVGAPGEPAVYIFRLENDLWVQESRLTQSTTSFGQSVALGQDYAAVGAPEHNGRGAVYLYTYSGGRWNYRTYLSPSQSGSQRFGAALEIHATQVAVGRPGASNQGAVSMYTFNGSRLVSPIEITSATQGNNAQFGASLAMTDDLVLVGAPYDNRGRVFSFRRIGGTWIQEFEFQPPPSGGRYYPVFGRSVAIDGNRVVIGGPSGRSPYSVVSVFERVGDAWARLVDWRPADILNFGEGVAISGPNVLVGTQSSAHFHHLGTLPGNPCPKPFLSQHPQSVNLQQGAAHTFEVAVETEAAPSFQWYHNGRMIPGADGSAFHIAAALPAHQGVYHCEVTTACDTVRSSDAGLTVGEITDRLPFVIPELEAGDLLGPIAVSGNRVALGAPGDDDSGKGAVYVYRWSGDAWLREAKILGHSGPSFGSRLDLSGERLAIQGGGALYLYHFQGGSWVLRGELTPSQSNTGFPGAFIVRGDDLFVGQAKVDSNRGELIRYHWNGTVWQSRGKLLSLEDLPTNANLGDRLALTGDHLIAGMPKYRSNEGSALIYRRRKGVWQPERLLTPPDFINGTLFGNGLAASGNQLAIGATGNDELTPNGGTVYLYENQMDTWRWSQKTTPSGVEQGDGVGAELALDGNALLIGSQQDDEGANAMGAAFLFQRDQEAWHERKKYIDPDGHAGDRMASYLALQGDQVWLGTKYADLTGVDSGKILLFGELPDNPDCLPGDVTRNGQISPLDASQVLIHVVGSPTEFDPLPACAADVTCNGSITAFDGAQILRFSAGTIDSLDCVASRRAPDGDLMVTDTPTEAVPFSVPLGWVGAETLSFELEIDFDPTILAARGVQAELPRDWQWRAQRTPDAIILAAAGASHLPDGRGDFQLHFIPLRLGHSELRVRVVSHNEHDEPNGVETIDIHILPCESGTFIDAVGSWPDTGLLDVVQSLQCMDDHAR
ncbi:Immunoglobulin domain-containing protein [Sulfidibacter corallicola]|uniref:Immunoglobulin domain-containing protein n=1 Tax=Sulfidibacter corallicola TaxID=2818388 RepID=A0A8A4U191_SULCO|nr:immunoglobulin domain-containing protein [Sulfidibacter corallicola]QTD52515.1 immunoglobulin domain-containing protein [Sulfidibacter corallicola]